MLKRYDHGYAGGHSSHMFPSADGDYVKWEDVRSLLLHLQPPAHGWTLETMAASMEELRLAAASGGPEPVGINGLTEAETSATASVFGLTSGGVGVPAAPSQPDAREAIAQALSEYRCQFTTCDEEGADGLPLVDKLTPPDQTSIDLGLKELEALADAIYDALPCGVEEDANGSV